MKRRFTLRVEDGGALLYDRESHAYFPYTHAEAFLLLASREVPIAQAVEQLAGRIGKRAARAAARGIELPYSGRVVELATVRGAYGAPLVAHLGVTQACNFSCAHCYSSSGRRAKGELSLEEIGALIGELSRIGCQKLVLGGGEPFLRQELPRIVRLADAKGVDCFVHTNGSLLTEGLLRELAQCPPAGLAVSVEGGDAATSDAVRGKRAFERALKGIRALRAAYPPGFNLSATIGPWNRRQTAGLVDLAKEVGARVLLLRPAYPAGEALSAPGLECSRRDFSLAVKRARIRARRAGVILDAPHPDEAGPPDFQGFGCVAARVVLGISPTGEVTPCLNLPGSFACGNVRDRPLLELWRAARSFVALRALTPPWECAGCAHWEVCRGGCRVRALSSGRGLSGKDSWCRLEKASGRAKLRPARSNEEGSDDRR
ncbi:MAG: radical SAM protein [Myxococcaceae bacterium]